ncbi:MAG: BrxE family protein [Deltaproteobacteria bacterium]|nr:BrxE family protein [Deltaproteobacteria bacterium]
MKSVERLLDLDFLLKLRLVVARYGEMDSARWWNTQGLLGRYGAVALARGFPRTHPFVQARIVFAVARSRCHEVFDPPGCMTLWSLPAAIEEQFDSHWQTWLDQMREWTPFLKSIEQLSGELLGILQDLALITPAQVETVGKLRRSAEGRAVPLPGAHHPSNDSLSLLAASFSCGEPGNLAVPYARLSA